MPLSVRRRGSAGPLLVFVHGWGFSSGIWDEVLARMQHRYRCLAVDLPGFGRSPPLACEYSLSVIGRELLDELPADALWVGWSLGALVAMQAALQRPAAVRALVLVAGTPSFVQRAGWRHGVAPAVLDGFRRDLKRDYRRTLGRFIMLQVRGSQAAREVGQALRHKLGQAPPPRTEMLAKALDVLQGTDLRHALGGISCPVTVLLGERDTLVPAPVSEDLHSLCPAWRVEVIPRAGHAPFLSHPELVCDRIAGAAGESP